MEQSRSPQQEIKTSITETVVNEWESHYSRVIGLHIPYFNRLPAPLRRRFLERTYTFRNLKKFHFVGMDEKAEIPILVSAAAIQLTLGLGKYELPFFNDIYVTADAYRAHGSTEDYIGHTSPSGIYLSWNYFLKGFQDDDDNVNVGIHEMAHALVHSHFLDEVGIDKEFRDDLECYCRAYGPELANWFIARRSYLRHYAFTNFHEFWAVSVEAFFESPDELKRYLPALYEALCRVLNQDPLSPDIVLASP